MLVVTKKRGVSNSVVGIATFMITLTVICIIIVAFAHYSRAVEIKKNLERVVNRYQYIMESNGGLDVSTSELLVADLEAVPGVIEGSVTLSGNAISAYPVPFNQNMTLRVQVKCNIKHVTLSETMSVDIEDLDATAVIERTCVSKGIH